jgi:hypothetical protein
VFAVSLKHIPALLVLIIIAAASSLAILDPSYRDEFMRLAEVMVAGFWGWMTPPSSVSKNNDR